MTAKKTSERGKQAAFIYRWSYGDDAFVWLGLAVTVTLAYVFLWVIAGLQAPSFKRAPGPAAIALTETVPLSLDEQAHETQLSTLPYIDLAPVQSASPIILDSDAFINLFGDGDVSDTWYYSEFRGSNHYWVDFVKQNVVSTVRGLSIYIREKDTWSDRFRWTSGQLSTRKKLGFGRYEAIMKPAYGSGLISSFFTYTGPFFKDPHDEIDFEFVGRSPRQVELNAFRNGQSYGHKRIDLWFDATQDYNLYAFEWLPDRIRWYVNDRLVGELIGGGDIIPQNPGFLYLNIWSGRTVEWHGPPRFGKYAKVSYTCVSYRAMHEETRSCSDYFTPPERDEE